MLWYQPVLHRMGTWVSGSRWSLSPGPRDCEPLRFTQNIANCISKRTTLLSTDGKGSLRSQANAVWGPKALEGVMDIDVNLQVEVDSLMARREGITEKSVFPVGSELTYIGYKRYMSKVLSPRQHGVKVDQVPTDNFTTSTAVLAI